jgi:hypothetical protein
MRPKIRLGPANLALVSLYIVPTWASDALRALLSPYGGVNDGAQAAATAVVRDIFNLGGDALMPASTLLAGLKLVMAVAFLAHLIEFTRAAVVGRELDRTTLNVVLLLGLIGIAIWAVPAFAFDDGAMIRRYATQLLLIAGASIVVMVERHAVGGTQAAAASTPAWS